MEQQNQNQSVNTRYSRCAVSLNQYKAYFSLTIMWMGFVLVATSMIVGDGLAAGIGFKHIILATLGDNISLSIVAVLISIIACKTGLILALLTRYSFGSSDSKAASIFVLVVDLGWYTIQAAIYEHFMAQVFHMGQVGEGLCTATSAIIMGIFATFGISATTILGYIAMPATVFLPIVTVIRSLGVTGGVDALLSYSPAASMSLFTDITAVIGTWVPSTATCIADIVRYAEDIKTAISATFTGLLGGNTLMIACGATATIAMGNSDLTVILPGSGLVTPNLILMTTNILTTNAANLYSTPLNLSSAFKMERKKMLAILLALSALVTLIRPYEIGFLFTFLNILGTVAPPLSEIILSGCFLIHKGSYVAYDKAGFCKQNPVPWITWAISVTLVYMIPSGLLSLDGIILGAATYTVLTAINKQRAVGSIAEEM